MDEVAYWQSGQVYRPGFPFGGRGTVITVWTDGGWSADWRRPSLRYPEVRDAEVCELSESARKHRATWEGGA